MFERVLCNWRQRERERDHMQQVFDSCSIFGGSVLSNGLIKRWSSHQTHSRKSSNMVKHEYKCTTILLFTAKNDGNVLNLKSYLIVVWCSVTTYNSGHVRNWEYWIFFVHFILLTLIFPIRMTILRIEESDWAWTQFSLYISIHLLCNVIIMI